MALEELQNGRYRRVRLIGSGGMGEVYLMQDTRVNRQVAIKVTRSEGSAYPDSEAVKEAGRLFQREARAIAALDHPHILPLYDFGEETSDGTTMTYMVMPFYTEGTLATWLQQGSTLLSLQAVSRLIEQAADALQFAHDHQVIHLDVKPSNFLLRANKKDPDQPALLLADFGVARSGATASSSSRAIRGTPTSMAPEQWSSKPVPATDQYALAIMAYELLTGRPPFVGGMEQLMFQHFNEQPPPPSAFNAHLPAALEAVLLRALAKKPEDRFPSIADFAAAFEEAVDTASPEFVIDQQRSTAAEVYGILTVSQAEAASGMSQMITLPGGQQVNVPLPAGTQNRQVIRLGNPDGPSSSGSSLIMTVAIKEPEKVQPSASTLRAAQERNTPPAIQQPAARVSDHYLPTVSTSEPVVSAPEKQAAPAPKRSSVLRLGVIGIVSVLATVLLLSGALFFYFGRQPGAAQTSAKLLAHSEAVTAKHAPSPTATVTPPNGLYIAGTYNGSMFNETTQQTTLITVFIMQKQGDGTLAGSVTFRSAPQGVYLLHGTDDMQGNFSFTMQFPSGQTPLLFYGTVQTGSYLHGNYCSTSTDTCLANIGYFTVGPRY